jgi:hypothetical protein
VLTPIFEIHWGLQNMNTILNPGNEKSLRKKQTALNKLLFNRLMKEVKLQNLVYVILTAHIFLTSKVSIMCMLKHL